MRKVLFIPLILLAVACQHATPEEEAQSAISEMEKRMEGDAKMDTALSKDLTAAYMDYAGKYPQDSVSPYYISKAADIYKEVPGQELKAVNTYNKVTVEYPEHPLAPRAIFMMGFVFDDRLHDEERAARTYAHFLSQYPDHPLATDANNLYEMLQDTLSEEEMIQQWMQQNQKDTNTNKQ